MPQLPWERPTWVTDEEIPKQPEVAAIITVRSTNEHPSPRSLGGTDRRRVSAPTEEGSADTSGASIGGLQVPAGGSLSATGSLPSLRMR